MSPARGHDPVIAERVRALTIAGQSAPVIAALLNVTVRTVTRYRQRTGISKPAPKPLTAEQLALAERLLDDGCSYYETARTVGVSPQGIRRRLPNRGWSAVECGSWSVLCRRMTGEDV